MKFMRFSVSPSRGFLLAVAMAIGGCHAQSSVTSPAVPLTGAGVTIYAAGDIADCRKARPEDSGAARTADLIAAALAQDPTAAVLTLGDHTYPIGLIDEFVNCYDPTWGRFKDRTYPSPGNHEYYSPAAAGYYNYFGDRAGPGRRGYYSFELGTWHIVSLNSYLQGPEQQRQLAWLKADLAAHPAHCTLAYLHHPMFSSGGHGNNERLRDLWLALEAAGADVILASHDHDYERFVPQDAYGRRDDARGIRQFVVGTGGAKLTPFGLRKWNSESVDNSNHGVLRLTLRDNGYEWEFLPVDKGGFTDRGSGLCH
ncbi:MAG TPA: metallophosphoesterase [Paucimonas sp.]|nr:metallophosphoesterase [Paucimonas sp.]